MSFTRLFPREFINPVKLPLHPFSVSLNSRSLLAPSPASLCLASPSDTSVHKGRNSACLSMDDISGCSSTVNKASVASEHHATQWQHQSREDLRFTNGNRDNCDNTGTYTTPASVTEPLTAAQEPLAEVCAEGRICVTPQELGSVAALAAWLKDRLPSGATQISEWGQAPGTKRVANLWLELSQGEISLEDSRPPIRTVHVASVKITNGAGKMLLEAHQEMADGSLRERNRPLSEKMKPGESVEDACLRGIAEELGLELGSSKRVKMMQDTYKRETQERESFSYPGLKTCYVLHYMEAVMDHLPAEDFITEENELCGGNGINGSVCMQDVNTCQEESAVGVKRHFWKWVPKFQESPSL